MMLLTFYCVYHLRSRLCQSRLGMQCYGDCRHPQVSFKPVHTAKLSEYTHNITLHSAVASVIV